jgi:hypothetical protein
LYAIPPYGYFIYALGWNIVFKLSWGYCIIYLKKSKMCVISHRLGILFTHGGMFLIVMRVLCKPWKHTMNIYYFMRILNWEIWCKMVIVCNDSFAQMHASMVQDFNLIFGMCNCN